MLASSRFISFRVENKMKIGYMFPVAIIVTAVVLMAWFVIGGYALPDSVN
ncbi:YoaK family small membrane protein [Serratia marcescens]